MDFAKFTTITQVRENLLDESDKNLLDSLVLKAENIAIKREIEKEISRLNEQLNCLDKRTLEDDYYDSKSEMDFLGVSSTKGMLIGEYVKTYLRKALCSNQIPKEEIELLKTKEYSKRVFDLNFPLLSKIIHDENGYARYYRNPVVIHGESFYLCSQWYKGSYPYVKKWLKDFGMEY